MKNLNPLIFLALLLPLQSQANILKSSVSIIRSDVDTLDPKYNYSKNLFYSCSATAISSRFVLTGGPCFQGDIVGVTEKTGELGFETYNTIKQVQKLVVSRKYEVALLELNEDLGAEVEFAQPFCDSNELRDTMRTQPNGALVGIGKVPRNYRDYVANRVDVMEQGIPSIKYFEESKLRVTVVDTLAGTVSMGDSGGGIYVASDLDGKPKLIGVSTHMWNSRDVNGNRTATRGALIDAFVVDWIEQASRTKLCP